MMTSLTGMRTILLNRLISRARCAQNYHTFRKEIRHPASEFVGLDGVVQVRRMSDNKGFFSNLIHNIKSEMDKNVEMKEHLKKFREEAAKLEQAESLQNARKKYNAIESETVKSSVAFKKKISDIQDKVKETLQESDYAKKGREIVGDVAETVGKAAETVSKQGEQIAQSQIFKSVSSGVKAVGEEIKESTVDGRRVLYKAPETLRRRDHFSVKVDEPKLMEEDTTTTGVVLSKDSRWFQGWENLKNNNPFITKLFDMKANYQESNNLLFRATRTLTDKAQSLLGGMFTETHLSKTLTEIDKVDPNFDMNEFLRMCQLDFVPNILEAKARGDFSILEDWCNQAVVNIISMPIKEAAAANLKFECKILDINKFDVRGGEVMDGIPVIVISFETNEVRALKDSMGNVVSGDPQKIIKSYNNWAFARDPEVFDPRAAWRVIHMQSAETEQWL